MTVSSAAMRRRLPARAAPPSAPRPLWLPEESPGGHPRRASGAGADARRPSRRGPRPARPRAPACASPAARPSLGSRAEGLTLIIRVN